MEDLFEIWDIVSGHVQDNLAKYVVACAIAVPFIFFTRRWTVPLILYTIEISIYMMILHVVVWVMVNMTAWFKNSSSMRALRPDGTPVDAVYWTTPLVKFWNKELYDPQWIIYMEGVFILILVVLVFKFRPLRTQKPKPRFGIDGTKKDGSNKDAQAVASKYGSRRYADEWAKEAAKSSQISRSRRKNED